MASGLWLPSPAPSRPPPSLPSQAPVGETTTTAVVTPTTAVPAQNSATNGAEATTALCTASEPAASAPSDWCNIDELPLGAVSAQVKQNHIVYRISLRRLILTQISSCGVMHN